MPRGTGRPRRPVLATLLLAACGTSSPSVQSGRWIGTLTPAAPDPACPPSRGVATVRDGLVTFTPDEGTWILEGTAIPDGTLTAEHTRPGANKQPYATRLAAKWTPTTITGTYTTPRCTFTVRLQRPS